MKILMVTRESLIDKRYGLNKSLAPIIAEIETRGIEVGYLCQENVGKRSLEWLQTTHNQLTRLFGHFFIHTEFSPLLWGILERLNMGRLAAKVMVQERYTHVHCHDPIIGAGYRWFARIRWLASLRRGHIARWGVTEHGFGCYAEAFHIDGARLGTRVMQWLRRWEAKILLKAHWVVAPTRSGLTQLSRDLSIHPLPNTWYAISHPRPILNHYSQLEARQRLGWVASTLYIIAVGRLVPLKQFPTLVKVCASLPYSHWRLVFIGEGERTGLQILATQLGISDKLDFAITDDMGLYYAAADIYVSVSLTESFGLANLEALIMGLPTLCTAVGGVAEVVGSGARLIPADDSQALSNALQSFLTDKEIRQYWSQQALQWIQTWPDSKAIAEAYLAMYQGMPLNTASVTQPQLPGVPYTQNIPFPFARWHQQIQSWPLCPLPPLLELPQQARILLIAPHSDDEILGCGGTLALLRQNGCHIKVVIITDGKEGDPLGYSVENVVLHRQRESIAALNLLGIEDVVFFNQPDSHYQHTLPLANQLTQLLNSYAADWLFLPSVLDFHRDHIAISLSWLEIWQHNGGLERVFLYEIWSPLPANWVVDISSVFALKQQSLQCYELPLKYGNYLAACVGMANYRALYLKQAGQYAEAFLELNQESWQTILNKLLTIREYQQQCLS
ncbi:group 1 glycosyl transferase [Thioploca ingrica]|uniref:Group 1 glycosyl transferase n=1 Tax=Thioploca ingrica TaxID=40754 RepID=A0A090ACQ1_9GAMM|nr:group 1 glycosyl transferase [Thioploca ingrica]